MIVVTLRMVVIPEKREDCLKTIRCILEPVRVQPGCLSFYLYQDVENENAFILLEEWTTRETLEGHIRDKNYRKLLALMDFLSEPPQVKFNTISNTQGMEYVVRVLGLNRSKLDVKEDLQQITQKKEEM